MSALIGVGVFLVVMYLVGVLAEMLTAMMHYDPALTERERKEAARRFRTAWKWPLKVDAAIAEIWREGREQD